MVRTAQSAPKPSSKAKKLAEKQRILASNSSTFSSENASAQTAQTSSSGLLDQSGQHNNLPTDVTTTKKSTLGLSIPKKNFKSLVEEIAYNVRMELHSQPSKRRAPKDRSKIEASRIKPMIKKAKQKVPKKETN